MKKTKNRRDQGLKMLAWASCVAMLIGCATGAAAQQAVEPAMPAPSQQYETIPDGTVLTLRFGSVVLGPPRLFHRTGSHKGDNINLVAANEVRLNNRVVIAKGAAAHATVAYSYYEYGQDGGPRLALRLDWVKSVIGTTIPLRASPTGPGTDFLIDIFSSDRGIEVRPTSFSRDMKDMLTMRIFSRALHEKTSIPVGARIAVYTDRAQLLELPELMAAQQRFPARSQEPSLTIYCSKGEKDAAPPWVLLSGKKMLQMSEHEYLTMSLRPGVYILSADPGKKESTFTVDVGQEYFFKLQGKGNSWELKPVDVVQADDEMADAVPSKIGPSFSVVDKPK